MPLIYRAMSRDGDKPLIAPSARGLGVRSGIDIAANDSGEVDRGSGGMSVAPHWKLLPAWRIPQRLASLAPKARGRNDDACWRFGEGGFAAEPIGENLHFIPDHQTHGLIEPSYRMSLKHYEKAIADTQVDWVIDESEIGN